MLVHLGEDTIVSTREIVGIFDMTAAAGGESTRAVLEEARTTGRLRDLSGGDAKSLVLTIKGTFLSPISPSTLQRKIAKGP